MRSKLTLDGNQAATYVSYAYSEVAAIYPITPSSTMAEIADEWSASGKRNIFGETVRVSQMQSEAGAAGAVHGALAAGALSTTFTASQGLLLMIPNLYKIAGEQLPGVFNVSARTIASHALSIFGDHSDVYACRQTGVGMLAESSVQQVMDLTPIAHMAAIKGKIPFINFFDGFRTSHEVQKVDAWDYEELNEMIDHNAIREFRKNALNPEHAREMGSAQNPDVFFQAREACNKQYDELPNVVEECFKEVNKRIGSNYSLFNYYGALDADHVIIAMGSVCQTIEEAIDYLNKAGEKTGLIEVHLYRPFSTKHLIEAIPNGVKKITVLDRTKEPGAIGEPLYLDVVAALKETKYDQVKINRGRYGLSSKDTTPEQIIAIYHNEEKRMFTIGINDDVTHLSLDYEKKNIVKNEGIVSCKFWGLGADGTVGANKNSIKIIGNHTDQYVQAYFDYDSKKSGGVTVSNLRFGTNPIRSAYLVGEADFVACHNETYIHKYDMVQEVKDGGTFLLNCSWSKDELDKYLPGQVKKYIADHNIQFYIINGIKIGKEIGLNSRINTILQSAFFQLSGIIPIEDAKKWMKEAAYTSYHKKGEKIVQMNYDAIDRGAKECYKVDIPCSWTNSKAEELGVALLPDREEVLKFVKEIQHPISRQQGNTLPVSAFLDYVDGTTPSGTSAHERRNIAVDVPVWNSENCIQCNRCSYVCPHATVRPVVMTMEEAKKAPNGMKILPMSGVEGMQYAITISYMDCTGCGSCASVCPGKKGEKALVMTPVQVHNEKQEYFDYAKTIPDKQEAIDKFRLDTVKGSQFNKPLLEFSGACAGCGETPYAKLITQLVGDRMYIANATGCSSIWGNSSPSTPYTVNEKGQGPAWSNSLFEDAAEFGYGMGLAAETIRDGVKNQINEIIKHEGGSELAKIATKWIDTYTDGKENQQASIQLIHALEKQKDKYSVLLDKKDYFNKKSQWVFGGDGWAYDIGFGGVDHVLASGMDINIFVFDTEVYSNTGGQSSKATPVGATAKFSANGKVTKKKDLAAIAMSYGTVYVAQIAMGADYNQTVKAICEAESYPGTSIIIAYAPCISHGIRAGLGSAQHEEEKAVKCGYWNMLRYDPRRTERGENPLMIDSKEPTESFKDFLSGEIRYDVVTRNDSQRSKHLLIEAEKNAKDRLERLKKLTD